MWRKIIEMIGNMTVNKNGGRRHGRVRNLYASVQLQKGKKENGAKHLKNLTETFLELIEDMERAIQKC